MSTICAKSPVEIRGRLHAVDDVRKTSEMNHYKIRTDVWEDHWDIYESFGNRICTVVGEDEAITLVNYLNSL
jgi:hypothetical protein